MNRRYIIDFKVANIPCRLIIDDKLLFDYFKKNYWSVNNQKICKVLIDVKGKDNLYQISIKSVKLNIKVDMKKKNLLFKDVDWIVRTMIQYSLLKFKVVFLHSSAAIFGNKVFIFLGESGKGKSTIIRNFDNNIVGDDIIILRKQASSFYVYQSPFEKLRVQIKKTLVKTKIGGLFVLYWGIKLEKKPIEPQKIVSLLLSDNYMPRLPKVSSNLYTELILDLIRKSNIVKLIFPKRFDKKDFLINYE